MTIREWLRQATVVNARADNLTDGTVRREGDKIFIRFTNSAGHSVKIDMSVDNAVEIAKAIGAVTGQ